MAKQLNMPIEPDVHRRAKAAAAGAGITLQAWVELAILAQIDRERKKAAK